MYGYYLSEFYPPFENPCCVFKALTSVPRPLLTCAVSVFSFSESCRVHVLSLGVMRFEICLGCMSGVPFLIAES